jgi:F420-dependent oxidoreductase-like protein
MRYGVMLDTSGSIDDVTKEVRWAAEGGLASVWCPQIFGYDALTLLAVVGREVEGIDLGTAVVPTYPRHPIVMASQALTTQAASGGRLALGIGLSHQIVIESMFGHSFDRPARHMREYLAALLPLLRGEAVSFQGETLKATTMGPLDVKAPAPPVLLAALAPAMLRLAGTVADGTITWMTGPSTLGNHIVPSITRAAQDAGRPSPRIVVGLPVCVTADVPGARERAARTYSIYGQLPSYRAMLDREGAAGPADVAIVGSEDEVAAGLTGLFDAGATEVVAAPFGSEEERQRTSDVLTSLATR